MNARARAAATMLALISCLWLGSAGIAKGPAGADEKLGLKEDRSLQRLFGIYFEAKDNKEAGKEGAALNEIKDTLADASKSWKLQPKAEMALKHIQALVAPLNMWPKYKFSIRSGRLESQTGDIAYDIHLPKGFRSARSIEEFSRVLVDLRPAAEAQAHFDKTWAGSPILDDTILLLPKPPSSGDWSSDEGIGAFLAPLGKLSWDQLTIDQNAWFLAGSDASMVAVANLGARFGERIAGLILRGGEPKALPAYLARNLLNTALYATAESPLTGELRKIGGAVTIGDGSAGDIHKWMAGVKRPAYPTKVAGVLPALNWGDQCWFKAMLTTADPANPPVAPDFPWFEASIDREKNTVTIATDGVLDIELNVNDAILDLDREIKVVANGVEVATLKGERDVKLMLENAYKKGERFRLFSRVFAVKKLPSGEQAPTGEKPSGDAKVDGGQENKEGKAAKADDGGTPKKKK
jgi:hypothetical protein